VTATSSTGVRTSCSRIAIGDSVVTTKAIKTDIRRAIASLVVALAWLTALWVAPVFAQQPYPNRPIRIVVPFVPGGGADTVARIIGQKFTESMAQQVIIDNRPGGGSVIASEVVAKAPPDGYTVYLASVTFTVAPILNKKVPFDPINDFAPVSRVSITPAVLVVHPSLPARSVQELVQLARSKPGQLSFGSAGIASASHLAGELFKSLAKAEMLHVPYKGSAQVITALLVGEVTLALINPLSALGPVRSGRLRLLAVSTAERSPALPDVPTISEAGVPGYESIIWTGMLLPGATPQPIITRLNSEIAKASRAKDVIERLAIDGSRPVAESPQDFAAFLKAQFAQWGKLITDLRIRAE